MMKIDRCLGSVWNSLIFLCAVALGGSGAASTANAQMASQGQFSVAPSGAATYAIPLAIPPAAGGMAPKLAIAYNSQGGNGLMGVGWSLSGLSSISRCPQSKPQDGAGWVRGVKFAASDRYCLDGQRLIAISGADGANGTEYRTEIESFSRVISYTDTSVTNGPASFVVKTKAGITMEFGRTADSRIELVGRTVIRAWLLNKVSDVRGNSYTVSYVKDGTKGEFYPSAVTYGPSTSPTTITFTVQTTDRPDTTSGLIAGTPVRQSKLLSGISVAAGGVNLQQYEFLYTQNKVSLQSVLSSIKTKVGGTYEPDLVLTRGNEATGVSVQLSRLETQQGGWQASAQWFPIDVNGDGLTDIVYVFNDGGYASIDVHINTGSGFVMQRWETKAGGYISGANGQWFVTDANGDGLPDVVLVFSDGGYISVDVHVNNKGSFSMQRWETKAGAYSATNAKWFVADANGDGLPDLIHVFSDPNFSNDGSASVDVHLNNGSSFAMQRWETTAGAYMPSNSEWFVADANGDGLPDLVHILNDAGSISIDVHVNSGGSTFSMQRWETRTGLYLGANANWFVADANGDGLPDLVYVFSDGGQISADVHVNSGSVFNQQRWETKNGLYQGANANWFVADANGDGLPDLVYVFNDNGYISTDVHVNSGNSFKQSRWETQQGTYLTSNAAWYNVDVTGDGIADLLYIFNDNGYITSDVHKMPIQNSQVTTFAKAGAPSVSVQYAPAALAYGKSYSASASSAYPNIYVTPGASLVTSYGVDNGVGGQRVTSMSYSNFKVQTGLDGRGVLGFEWVQSKDLVTGLTSRTCYRQDWPYVGMANLTVTATTDAGLPAWCLSFANWPVYQTTGANLSAFQTAGWNLLSMNFSNFTFTATDGSGNATTCKDPDVASTTCSSGAVKPGRRYQIYGNESFSQSRDWDGTSFLALPASHTTQAQDSWGNVTSVMTETLNNDGKTPSGYSKTTTNTYAPADTANWLLGRLIKSSVTATAP